MKDGLVRAETLPLVFRVPGTEGMARGTRVKARVVGADLLTLELHTALLARLEAEPAATEEAGEEEEEEAPAAISLAIDVADAEPAAEAPADAAPAAPAP
jgi:exoribonuclease-2